MTGRAGLILAEIPVRCGAQDRGNLRAGNALSNLQRAAIVRLVPRLLGSVVPLDHDGPLLWGLAHVVALRHPSNATSPPALERFALTHPSAERGFGQF